MGVIRAFSNSYVMYICFEFLEAFVGGGVYSTAFILGDSLYPLVVYTVMYL